MNVRILPGGSVHGHATVPGDKSISHRWLIMAATARGTSVLWGLPVSLDVRSTARCLASVTRTPRRALKAWAANGPATLEGGGSTWNAVTVGEEPPPLEVEGEGRDGLVPPTVPLDCGNAGTAMRLLTGVLAGAPFASTLIGDESLSRRPMERVAVPVRAMGATVRTVDGHAPVEVVGGPLTAIQHEMDVASAQVKSAILLAGLVAEGRTTVREPRPTRDHTERLLEALGASIEREGTMTGVARFQHEGFSGRVPGDPSSAAFLLAAAALTRSELTIEGIGLNPTRLHFLDVMSRMGIDVTVEAEREEMGEPVGRIRARATGAISPVRVEEDELPLVIDEVPVLAALAAHARGDSWFLGAGELRVKESDRLGGLAAGLRSLGGEAADEGDDLVVAGGGLVGGTASSGGDHRLAMAFVIAALGAQAPCDVRGVEVAEVSYPGFVSDLRAAGVRLEVSG